MSGTAPPPEGTAPAAAQDVQVPREAQGRAESAAPASAKAIVRNVLFQLHWILGITAGLVLAVMGLTGSTLAFENEIQRALNPGIVTVALEDRPALTPPELLAKIAAEHPERRIGTISVAAIPGRSARVGFVPAASPGPKMAREAAGAPDASKAPGPDAATATDAAKAPDVANAPDAAKAPEVAKGSGERARRPPGERKAGGPGGGAGPNGGRVRMEVWFVQPYTGALLAKEDSIRGHATLDFLEDIHRRLGWGDTGKVITGVCAFCLVFFALSGLYLRWPRQVFSLRTWFVPRWRQRGRPFLVSLHGVAGTFVLVPYLVSALTGLTWSFDWYRNGLNALAGVTPPPRQGPPAPGAPGEAPDLTAAWQAFVVATKEHGWSTASFNPPGKPDQPLTINYLDADPAHERASNRMTLDPVSGAVTANDRYADRTAGGRLVASIFPLHRGSWLGVPGTLVMMTAALSMPVFAVTGWMAYLKRRRSKAERCAFR